MGNDEDIKGTTSKGIQMFTILMEILKVAAQKGKGWQFTIMVVMVMLAGPALVSYSGGYLGTGKAISDLEKEHQEFREDINDLAEKWEQAQVDGQLETPEVKELRVQKIMSDQQDKFFNRVKDAVKLGVLEAMKDHTERYHSQNRKEGEKP